jgi:hypothetical protein
VINKLLFYWKRLVSLVTAFPAVQKYRLQRAYLLEAYEQFPGLKQRMLIVWLILAILVFSSFAIRTIDLSLPMRICIAVAFALCIAYLYPQAYRLLQEDSKATALHHLSCLRSKYLRRNRSRY